MWHSRRMNNIRWGWLHGKISAWAETRPGRPGWKKAPITWDISTRAETEIGTEHGQEFFGSLCFLALYIFSRASTTFSAGAEIFSCYNTSFFCPVNQTEIFSPSSSNRAENSSLIFQVFYRKGRAEIFHVISPLLNDLLTIIDKSWPGKEKKNKKNDVGEKPFDFSKTASVNLFEEPRCENDASVVNIFCNILNWKNDLVACQGVQFCHFRVYW